MFSRNVGDEILSVAASDTSIQGCATRDRKTGEIIVKLVNPQPSVEAVNLEIKGVDSLSSTASVLTLAASPEDTNSIMRPRNVVPIATTLRDVKAPFIYPMPPNSIVVLRFKARS
jgi:alpha-L-arabinofuranosidase